VYLVLPPNQLSRALGPVDAAYFSIVTQTTLGYGEIHPIGKIGKLIAAGQALGGVVLIGMFLARLSKEWADRQADYDKRKIEKNARSTQLSRLRAHGFYLRRDLESYFFLANRVVSNMSDWHIQTFAASRRLRRAFDLQSLSDMFRPVFLGSGLSRGSAIEEFMVVEERLRSSMRQLSLSLDPTILPEIFEVVQAFEDACDEDGLNAAIAEDLRTSVKSADGTHPLTETIQKYLDILSDRGGEVDDDLAWHMKCVIPKYSKFLGSLRDRVDCLRRFGELTDHADVTPVAR
jgi:hypothetical protein